MQETIKYCLAIALSQLTCASLAAKEVTQPTEVGTTTMPPGEYVVTDKHSSKTYSLMVTGKGTMILSPGAASVSASSHEATASAATTPAAATPAAGAQVPAQVTDTKVNSTVQTLMQKGYKEGLRQLRKHGGTNQLQNLIK